MTESGKQAERAKQADKRAAALRENLRRRKEAAHKEPKNKNEKTEDKA